MHASLSLMPLLVAGAVATNLYVSSYSGVLTTLSFSKGRYGNYTLAQTFNLKAASSSPSWLTLDPTTRNVYYTGENAPGTVASYSTSSSGRLTQLKSLSIINEPVHSVIYNDGKALALAHYGGSAVTSYLISKDGGIQSSQNFSYAGLTPTPHPHQVVLDPSGKFILVPDLGSDLLRLYSINPANSILTGLTPTTVPTGSGPRHAAFLKADSGKTYLFLLSELSATVSSYEVTYPSGGINLSLIETQSIYGGTTKHTNTGSAELLISPDKKFVLTSSRGDNLFNITNPSNPAAGIIPSDSLQVFKIDAATGKLVFNQLAPSGGKIPRQFSLNKAGNLAAVGLQADGRVVIYQRDVSTGKLGGLVAAANIDGQVNTVIWDEK